MPLYTIGTDAAKSLIVSRLSLTEKGPGFVHMPHAEWADEELAAQLTSERLVTVWSKGIPSQVWRKVRPRNEMLDAFVYAVGALRLIHPNLPVVAAQLAAMAGTATVQPLPRQAAPSPPPQSRRIARSGYLGR